MSKTSLYKVEFGGWVRSMIGSLTLRQAEIRTGISNATIYSMTEGKIPGEAMVIRFATGFKQDVEVALRLAGYEQMADLWKANRAGVLPTTDSLVREERARYKTFYEEMPEDVRLIYEQQAHLVKALSPRRRQAYINALEAVAQAVMAMVEEE